MIGTKEVDDFLEHHGVKGMKWGVRNDKAGSKNGRVGMTEDEARAAVFVAIGAAFVAAHIARATVMFRDSGRRDAKKTGERPFKKNPALAKKMSVSQLHSKVVVPINPGYGEPGTKMNCRRATMAYEMRRRGYDVKATKSMYASGQTIRGLRNAADISKDTRFQSVWGEKQITDRAFVFSSPQQKADVVFKALSSNPNGSRGELGLAWSMGGGHSMAWEIVNKKPVIFDNQNGKVYDSAKSFSAFTPVMATGATTRLDDKPLDNEFLKRWVTDV